jgi:hypothetical protein
MAAEQDARDQASNCGKEAGLDNRIADHAE